MNLWIKIIEWFQDVAERHKLIVEFNKSAKEAWIEGIMPVRLEAKMSRGNPAYKHQYSNWLYSGIRLKAFSGVQLSKNDLITLGEVILSNPPLIRRLVVLGFDTLEVHCDAGTHGCQWQLKDYAQIG